MCRDKERSFDTAAAEIAPLLERLQRIDAMGASHRSAHRLPTWVLAMPAGSHPGSVTASQCGDPTRWSGVSPWLPCSKSGEEVQTVSITHFTSFWWFCLVPGREHSVKASTNGPGAKLAVGSYPRLAQLFIVLKHLPSLCTSMMFLLSHGDR